MTSTTSVLAFAKKPVGVVMMRSILQRLLHAGDCAVFGAARLSGRAATQRVFDAAGVPDVRVLPEWWCRLHRFDVYLSADFGVIARRARLKVHVFHGVSFRNHAVHENALRYDLCLLAGPYMRRRFEQLGIVNAANAARFPVIGMPKLDDLVNGRHERSRVLGALGLDPTRATLLYAPTWSRKASSLEHWGDAVLDALAALPVNVVVKLHDNTRDPRKASRDWVARVRAIRRAGFVLDDGVDVVPLMAAADVLLSDASSVANEFTLLDRPILFLDVTDLRSKLKDKADLDTWGRSAGDVVPDPGALGEALERALAEPARLSTQRRALAQDLFHDAGRATERAVDAIRAALAARAPRHR